MTWDLADILAEREQPTTEVKIYPSEKLSAAKAQLEESLLKLTDGDEREAVENSIEEINRALKDVEYTVHIRNIPRRMREDITSRALHDFPVKPNFLGQDDVLNARDRQARETHLLWTATITDVVNPRGEHKTDWTVEQMTEFEAALPTPAANKIDAAIKKLHEEAEKFTAENLNPDF